MLAKSMHSLFIVYVISGFEIRKPDYMTNVSKCEICNRLLNAGALLLHISSLEDLKK